MKPTQAIVGSIVFIFVLTALPLSVSSGFRSLLISFFRSPISASEKTGSLVSDLVHFRRNSKENEALRKEIADHRDREFHSRELDLENARLVRLLELKNTAPPHLRHKVFARVIARSPLTWDRALVLDKGTRDGIRPNMLVLSDLAVIGKVLYAGPAASKVILVNDPNFRLGVLIQRTRQQGILYGVTAAGPGECRVKYLSLNAEIRLGDVIETAGFGSFVPKGLLIGTVKRAFKSPGQIYQVAQIQPSADSNRAEEVMCVE